MIKNSYGPEFKYHTVDASSKFHYHQPNHVFYVCSSITEAIVLHAMKLLPHIPKYCPLALQAATQALIMSNHCLHSPQVFLPLPTHLTHATTTFLQVYIHSSTRLRSECVEPHNRSTLSCSKCPNHLNLPYSHTLNPKKTTNPHCALCPSATLHTFILSSHYAPTALSRLCRLRHQPSLLIS